MTKKSQPKATPTPPAPVVDDPSTEAERYISVKDVVLAYALRGTEGLDALALEAKSHLLRKAVALCRVEGNNAVAEAIVAYANARGIVVWPGRGRGIPQEGETRSYKAQQLEKQDPFIRLPVSALRVRKGQVVTVRFASGVIEVRAGA